MIAAAEISHDHVNHIEEIIDWWAGFDESGREIAADFMVMGSFRDSAAVARYLEHPHHKIGVEAWREISHWVVADVSEDTVHHRGGEHVHDI